MHIKLNIDRETKFSVGDKVRQYRKCINSIGYEEEYSYINWISISFESDEPRIVYHCRPTREREYYTKSFGSRSNIYEDLKTGELATFTSEMNGKAFPVASKFDEPLLDKINSKDQ